MNGRGPQRFEMLFSNLCTEQCRPGKFFLPSTLKQCLSTTKTRPSVRTWSPFNRDSEPYYNENVSENKLISGVHKLKTPEKILIPSTDTTEHRTNIYCDSKLPKTFNWYLNQEKVEGHNFNVSFLRPYSNETFLHTILR